MDDLRILAREDAPRDTRRNGASALLAECKDAVARMDRHEIEAALGRASVGLSTPDLLEQLVAPLMEHIGAMWREGALRVAHEHVATDAVRNFLASRRAAHRPHEGAAAIVVATPSGQTHEIGALMVSLLACVDGWRDVYLGPNLPGEDIVAAVRASGAKALALSIVYPANDPAIVSELSFLAQHLPRNTKVFIGGRSAKAYAESIRALGAEWFENLGEFRAALERLRLTDTTPAVSK